MKPEKIKKVEEHQQAQCGQNAPAKQSSRRNCHSSTGARCDIHPGPIDSSRSARRGRDGLKTGVWEDAGERPKDARRNCAAPRHERLALRMCELRSVAGKKNGMGFALITADQSGVGITPHETTVPSLLKRFPHAKLYPSPRGGGKPGGDGRVLKLARVTASTIVETRNRTKTRRL
jgi:hypothetical protein